MMFNYRNSLLVSSSTIILMGSANAMELTSLLESHTHIITQVIGLEPNSLTNESYQIAATQFLPDIKDSELGFNGRDLNGDYNRIDINDQKCPTGYQNSPCSDPTPVLLNKKQLASGMFCYQCDVIQCDANIYKYAKEDCEVQQGYDQCGGKSSSCVTCEDMYGHSGAYLTPSNLPSYLSKSDCTPNGGESRCLYECGKYLAAKCSGTPYCPGNTTVYKNLYGYICASHSPALCSSTLSCPYSSYSSVINCASVVKCYSGNYGCITCKSGYTLSAGKCSINCSFPKVANATETSCECPAGYKHTASNCNGTLGGSVCDGKYLLCIYSGGGGTSSSEVSCISEHC